MVPISQILNVQPDSVAISIHMQPQHQPPRNTTPLDVDAQLTTLSQAYKAELMRQPDELQIRKFLEARDQGDFSTARKHYLQAQGIDEKTMVQAFYEAGKTMSWRVLPASTISLLPGLCTLIPISTTNYTAQTKRALGYFVTTLAASLISPLVSAMTFQYAIQYSEAEFRNLGNMTPEMKTPQIAGINELLAEALKNAEAAEKQMMEAMTPGKNLSTAEVEKLKKTVDEAIDELTSSIHQYVLRSNLNDVYFKGGQRQGIINALRFLCNLSGGWGAFFAKDARIGYAIQAFGVVSHMIIQRCWAGPCDEIDKQNQIIHLKLLSTKLDLGDINDPNRDPAKQADALEQFSKQIRTPMGIRVGMLEQVISYDIKLLEQKMAKMLSMEPKTWRRLQTLEDSEAPNDEEKQELAQLRTAIAQAREQLNPQKKAKLAAHEEEWKSTRQDPAHVLAGNFDAVSNLNKHRTYLGLQITDRKDANGLPDLLNAPERHLARQAGHVRIATPGEFIPVAGQMFWTAFQLLVCGTNGPLLLSQALGLKDAFMKQHDHDHSPEARDRLIMLAFTCMIAVMGMMAANRLIKNRLRPPNVKLHANIAASTQGSAAVGCYNVLKLYKRQFLRDLPDDRKFQHVGTSALGWNYIKSLGKTIMSGLFILATEGWAAGPASEKYEKSVAALASLNKHHG